MRHAKAAIGARVHVREGAEVRAGDLLITLETAGLDRRIAALKAKAQSVDGELHQVSQGTLAIIACRGRTTGPTSLPSSERTSTCRARRGSGGTHHAGREGAGR